MRTRDGAVRGALAGAGWGALMIFMIWWPTITSPGQEDDFTLRYIGARGTILLGVATAALLTLRRRNPLVVLVVTGGVDFCSTILKLPGGGYHWAGLFGIFFVAVRWPFMRALALSAVPAVCTYLAEVHEAGGRWLTYGPAWILVSTLFAVSLGQVRYLRESLYASLEARAESAEATRDAVARRQVAEDRLQTARDLHDLIGHRIAVVHLRAEVALRGIGDDPKSVRGALVDIDDAARAVLDDIDHLLADLRRGDASTPHEHELHEVDDLVDRFRGYGLDVAVRVAGRLDGIPRTASVVAYQAVSETLTNVLKHGSSERCARLSISRSDQRVHLQVSNPTGARSTDRSGWGLCGLRERVRAVGGEVAITSGRVFVVDVCLPLGVNQ